MDRKIIFVLMALFVAIASLSSVSAWWIFGDGGTDVTVNDVTFHLPKGFNAENPVESESDTTYEQVVYKNTENKDKIDIMVEDKSLEDSVIENSLIKKGFEQKTISGKEGFYRMYSVGQYEFVYIDNDEVVSIVVPDIYDEYGDDFMAYDELLDVIIK